MKARINFAIDALVVAIYLVATNPSTTGTPVHEWFGIAVGLVAFVHLVMHWDWVTRIAARFFKRLGAAPRVNFAVDTLALIAFVTVCLSGLLVSRSVLKPLGFTVAEHSVWHAVHSQSATVLLALIGVHLGLHWTWIVSAFRHRVFRPLMHPWGALGHLRERAARQAEATAEAARPVSRHGARHALAALVVVAATAVAVYGVALGAGDRLLIPWLTVPGGAGTGLSAASQPAGGAAARTTRAAVASDSPTPGDKTDRQVEAAVRSVHAFLVLGLSMMLASGLSGLLRPR